MGNWAGWLKSVRDNEIKGHLVDEREEWLHEWKDGAGMREIADRAQLDMPALALAVKSHGIGSLSPMHRVALLHLLIEQVLAEDKDIWKRMDPSEVSAQRAALLGKDSAGRWHYHLPALQDRVYSLASPWRPKPLPPPPHLVRVGERIEVEVRESDKDATVEWRGAKVLELLAGGNGRFTAMVDGTDGLPDEEFIEIFTSPLLDKEWRKVAKKEPAKKEPKEAPAKVLRESVASSGRRTRVSDGTSQPTAPLAPAPAAAGKKPKLDHQQRVEQQQQQTRLQVMKMRVSSSLKV